MRPFAAVALATCAAWGVVVPEAAEAAPDRASRVDVFAGSEPGAPNFHTGGGAGNTFPGPVLPFGMVQFSPDTLPGRGAFGGGYTHADRRIKGFSVKHLSGPGCAAYQDFPLMPTTAPIDRSPAKPRSIDLHDAYTAGFSHTSEEGRPGFYRVTLDPGTDHPIEVRLSATRRTGFARLTFPAGKPANVLINATGSAKGARTADVRIDPERHEISGSATSGDFCGQGNRYKLHFVARFTRGFAGFGTWKGHTLAPGSQSTTNAIPAPPDITQPDPGEPPGPKDAGRTAQAGAYASFDTSGSPYVGVRIGVSFVSVEGARRNLDIESGGRSFDEVRDRARAAWNEALGRITVRGGDRDHLELFDTQLYRSLIHPSTFSDADRRYVGFDGRIHHVPDGHVHYADFSGWDTYRSQMPLVAMLFPRRAADMVRSLLAAERQSGALPKWSQANGHTRVMVGDPADLLIAGAHAFGARDFDTRAALAAMVRGATRYRRASGEPPYYQRPGLPAYLRRGYVPHEWNTDPRGNREAPERVWGSVSTTLEYAVADFAIAQLARAACRPGTYQAFMRRAGNWRNVFDPRARQAAPRFRDGRFKPSRLDAREGFVEGSAGQYTLFVPQDPAGLMRALGGRGDAMRRLDDFFRQINAGPASRHAYLGNEPSLGTPWLYHWLGRPDRSAAVVRQAMLELFGTGPTGYPGNDDLGSMASWWVFGALGLYPAVPGTDLLTVGSPLFRKATVRLPRGTLRIRAHGAAPGRPYVHQLKLDGRRRDQAWVSFARLRHGATLDFRLGAKPKGRFGRAQLPPSGGPGGPSGCR